MKASVVTLMAAAGLLGTMFAQAQYKSPSSYLQRKNPNGQANPAQGAAQANGGQPGAPARPGQPAKPPPPPKFKELAVNSPFYFVSDTNRAFTWIKVSSITASNAKNGVVAN